jgi:hypothetical protein
MEADISTWRKTGHFYFALTLHQMICQEMFYHPDAEPLSVRGRERNSLDRPSFRPALSLLAVLLTFLDR